jgi:uncharacterized protein (TIGR03083 family)
VDRTDSESRRPRRDWSPGPALAALHDGVTVICQLAAEFTGAAWAGPTPCPEWRVSDLAGHLRCVADDYHEYLDDAPASRLARLMGTGAHPATLARKLARQNAAELAALPDASGPEHIAAFARSARSYAQRLLPVWDLPHHRYREVLVTVGGMAGAACAEWHLHAWDLARALGKDYRPADPEILLRGWLAGMPHLPPAAAPGGGAPGGARVPAGDGGPPDGADRLVGARYRGAERGAAPQPAALRRPGTAGPASGADPWHAMLRASGRMPAPGTPPGPGLYP